MKLYFKEIPSVVGKLKLIANEKALIAILWEKEKPNRFKLSEMVKDNSHPILQKTEKELLEYFSGERESFDITLEMNGTEFQKRVWSILKEIPYGTTWTYAQVAKKLENPKAVRAVGGAIGRNPLSIIIPCHRVIGTNGKLTGFAGGLQTKSILLQLEKS